MGKKILVPCLDVIMIAFFAKKYTVKDHISNTKLKKGDYHTSKLGTRIFFPRGGGGGT